MQLLSVMKCLSGRQQAASGPKLGKSESSLGDIRSVTHALHPIGYRLHCLKD